MNKKILTVTLNPAIDYTIEVPDFAIDAVNRASTGRRDPGGKGVNDRSFSRGRGESSLYRTRRVSGISTSH
ncbi:MAG: hypothetical protein PF518_12575 [Spirochaetaceae bacterium]|nr:hypothetical protein [Spirochaetaceae bacterium]